MSEYKEEQIEKFFERAGNVGELNSLLSVRNLCLINACDHAKGRDNNRCLVDYEFTYLGPDPLPKKTEIDGVTYEGRLPIEKQPMSAQAYLYTDESLEINFYYINHKDDDDEGEEEEEYVEDIDKVLISTSENTGTIKSISLYLEDFWYNDPSEIITLIVNALETKRWEAMTHDEHLNCIAVQKIVELEYENCIYDMLFLFKEIQNVE